MLEPFDYEVAIEILGQSKQPLVKELNKEWNRTNGNELYTKFLEARLKVINDLMDELSPQDEYLVKRILDKNDVIRNLL